MSSEEANRDEVGGSFDDSDSSPRESAEENEKPRTSRSASSDSWFKNSSGFSSDDEASTKTRFLRELGHGASGVVYETVAAGGTTKAIKTIPFEGRGVPYPLEAAVMRSIEHPYLASAETITVCGDKLCIVSAEADCDLTSKVRTEKGGKPVTGTKLREWVRQLVSALLCMHNENLIHADVKPANVLVYGDNLRLCDMTLVTRAKTSSGTIIRHHLRLGTPRYRAPEVRDKSKEGWSFPADMWSLGCTIFEMGYGRPFFHTPKNVSKSKEKIEEALDGLIKKWKKARERGKTASYFTRNGGDMPEFNDLVRRMLDCNQFTRITAVECFAHPYLQNASRPTYSVGTITCSDVDRRSWVGRLLSYLTGLDMDDELKIDACQSLVDKMNHKHPNYEELDEEDRECLKEAEIQICEFLGWHLL